MNRFYSIAPFLFLLSLVLIHNEVKGAVTVTPASGTCLNVAPGAYSAIGSIVIDENNNGDFANQANVTIILTAPAGFQFQVATGAVGYQGGRNISAAAIVVTATTVTVTYSCSGTNRDDRMTISGLFARATVAGASGTILRTAGTATINGDANGAGVDHGALTASNAGVTITSAANGSWTTGTTWVGGVVPACGASVIVLHTVTANAAVSANNLTINTGGILTANNPITVSGTFTINGTGSYIHDNVTNVSTTIFAGTESFSTTSSITINQWYNTGFPLPTNVSGNFGNVTFNEGNGWSQDGMFAPAKIKGTLTVNSGQITMDDGTGMTTALTLQDVIMNGSGVVRMATGANRDLTLITGNYTDNRTGGSSYSGVQFNCAGNVTWTVNGNVTIDPNWSFFEGTGATVGNSNITINGNLNITGGLFDFNRNVDAPLTLLVTGNTTISGSPGWVRFLDRNNKTLTFTTTNFYINSGTANNFNGGSNPTGTSIFNITNDLILTTTSTVATLVNSTPNAAGTTLNVGRDLIVNDGDFRVANSNAPVTVNVTRNLIVNGVNGDFYGQIYPNNTSLSTVNVSGTLQVNNGDYYTSIGQGNISMNITEVIDVNNGRFFGIYNLAAANNGSVSLTVNDIDFDGGTFSLMNATISDGKTVQVNCNNDIFVDFLNTTDVFTFIALAGTNNALLDLNVTNNVTIGGNFAGSYFLSSASSGNETVDIGGNFTINDGDVSFVGNETSLINTHNIVTNITGNLTIAGGVTRLTTGIGTADININGNVTISNGTLNLKYDTGITTMDVAGSYTQSGGTFNLHSRAANTTDPITVTVNGDFAMSNGTLNFDNQASGAGLAEHLFYNLGANYTLSGSAIITHANNLTNNYIFGQMYFSRVGTTTYLRNSSTNEIRHVKYTINSGTIVNATTSPNGFQMTSIGSNVAATHNSLTVNGTIDMGSEVLSARQNNNYYSRVTVNSGGRYRTSHPGGLYSGSNVIASSINGYSTTFNRVNYQLDPSSTVEYYGTTTTTITGIPNGYASTNAQKYGILEINFTGSAGTTWVTPETNDEVFVRTSLILTNGELNLDDDHVTNTGGKLITLESGCTTSRTNGFIRSETEDASGMVNWIINTNGSRIVPFGYDAASYIPLTFQQTSGAAGTVSFATYRTASDNTPFPATVTHVRDVSGADNSSNTVDRFWHISTTGTADANLTFSYVSSEGTGILAPRAQLWEPVSTGWFPPVAGQSNPTATSTLAGPIAAFNTWWTLAAGSSPLPIELVSFEVKRAASTAAITWQTASEINNDYFTVERSDDGINFEMLLKIDGAGNSTSVRSYSANDESPLKGINYYRLKQTDFDGKFTFSEIKSIYFGKAEAFSVYPNPVASNSDFTISVPDKSEYSISIIELTGKIIYSENSIAGDKNEINVRVNNLAVSAGIYQLVVRSANDQYTQKLIIRKGTY